MLLRLAIVITAIAWLLSASAENKKAVPLTRHAGLSASVAKLEFVSADQACENFAWAATLETILRAQNVTLNQEYWINQADSGVCLDKTPAVEELARLVQHDYQLDDARKVHLYAHYVTGAPTTIDDVIASLKSGRPLLLLWKSHPYVLHSVVYDEYVYPNGQKMFELLELKLMDPLPRDGNPRPVFIKGIDNANEIEGVLDVEAKVCPASVAACF
jgi:hypothetical protein